MNIEKIKEFINIRKELKSVGVIGVSIINDDIHVDLSVLSEMSNIQFESFKNYDSDYPFKAYTTVDGIKFFALVGKDDVKNFPQLEGYMVEDVNLTGDENVAI